jgi:hypothetical protein
VSARALVLPTIVAALLAGCAGNDDTAGDSPEQPVRASDAAQSPKAHYSEQFRKTLKTIEDRAPENVPPRTIPLRILDAASALERIEPPADIRRAHRRYIAGLRQTARDIQPVIEGHLRGDPAATKRMLDLSWISPRSVRLVRSSRLEFAAKGYDLGDVTMLPKP